MKKCQLKVKCPSFGYEGQIPKSIQDLPTTSRKADLIKVMSGHVLQSGEVIGWCKP